MEIMETCKSQFSFAAAAVAAASLLYSTGAAFAGPLEHATINKIINDVRVINPKEGARPANLREVIKDDLAVKTGVKSRAELLFQDNTLTRLGAETFFSFHPGTRDLSLDQGTLLLQVPKGLGGAKIKTAAVTASITGTTILIEHFPRRTIKVAVLEGSLRLTVNGRFGDSVLLTPGKMVVMRPDAKRIPDPVDVNLQKLVKTSSLIDPEAFRGASNIKVEPLPSAGLIDKEIARQGKMAATRELIPSNLVIFGQGSKVQLANAQTLAQLDSAPSGAARRTDAMLATAGNAALTEASARGEVQLRALAENGMLSGPLPSNPSGNLPPDSNALLNGINQPAPEPPTMPQPPSSTQPPATTPPATTPPATTPPATIPPATTPPVTPPPPSIPPGTTPPSIPQPTPAAPPLINASGWFDTIHSFWFPSGAPLNRVGSNGLLTLPPGDGGNVQLIGWQIDISSSDIAGINLNGGDAGLGLAQQGGSGGALRVGTNTQPISGQIGVYAPILATTGKNSFTVANGGAGGSVEMFANDKVEIKNLIKVSDSGSSRASRSGGNVRIESRLAGSTAISVENSAQILSLLAASAPGPGGSITLYAPNGSIDVKDSTLRADRGLVEVRSDYTEGQIELQNATLRGDTIKVATFGANGELIIGRSNLTADTAIKLYATGANGHVRFVDDTTLGGNSLKTIAGRTVTIENGKTVTIGGAQAAKVFTDRANYTGSGGNGSKTGTFAGAGATTHAFDQKPAY